VCPFSSLDNGHVPRIALSCNDTGTEKCECPSEHFKKSLRCDGSGHINAVLDCDSLTYESDTNTVEVGRCMHNCAYIQKVLRESWTTFVSVSPDPDNWTSSSGLFAGYLVQALFRQLV